MTSPAIMMVRLVVVAECVANGLFVAVPPRHLASRSVGKKKISKNSSGFKKVPMKLNKAKIGVVYDKYEIFLVDVSSSADKGSAHESGGSAVPARQDLPKSHTGDAAKDLSDDLEEDPIMKAKRVEKGKGKVKMAARRPRNRSTAGKLMADTMPKVQSGKSKEDKDATISESSSSPDSNIGRSHPCVGKFDTNTHMSVLEYARWELLHKRKFLDDRYLTEHTLRRAGTYEWLEEADLLKSVLKVHSYIPE